MLRRSALQASSARTPHGFAAARRTKVTLEVLFDGQSFYDLSLNEGTRLRRERISFVFQTFNLVPYLTALENVQVSLYLKGVTAIEQRRRAAALLEQGGTRGSTRLQAMRIEHWSATTCRLGAYAANNPQLIGR